MLLKRLSSLVLGLAVLFAIVGCGNKSAQKSGSLSAFPRSETLYVSGFLWSQPSSFNPLGEDPSFPMTGDVNLVYESMFGYNLLTGELEGILGKEYSLDGNDLTVTLNENAKWQDGTPVTTDDVLFTFNLHKKYDTNLHSVWEYISDIKVVDAQKVTFVLSEEKFNPLVMKEIISTTYILPKSVYGKIESSAIDSAKTIAENGKVNPSEVLKIIRAFKNDVKPMGSGPYTLMNYSIQKVALIRVDGYWGNYKYEGKEPAPKYIVHPLYKSNDKFNLALLQGDCDLSQNFVPQIWNKFGKGVGTWYKEKPYYVPGTIPAMLMALTKKPFSDPAFRRAIAYSVDYEHVLNFSIYGYAPPLSPGLILAEGPESVYYNKDDAKKYGLTYDVEKAKSLLKEAGYSWGADSMLVGPDGNKLPQFTATCPNGWTDWESVVKTFVKGLRSIGVDVREKFLEEAVWDKNLMNGNFDFTMYTPLDYQSIATPWARFDKVLSSAEWAPVGQVMWQNQGRYKNPVADSLLKILPKLTDDAEIKATYRELNLIFMKDLPIIPLMNRPWFFYEFSTKHWTNFPTADNPYAPPQCLMVGAGIKGLWGIKPAESK